MGLKKRLIPTLLLRNGRCVKGRQFQDFRDTGNPLTAARIYDAQGADELIFLDIEATKRDQETTLEVIQHVAEECFMPLCVGGGVRNIDDFRRLLVAGADKVSINTAAVETPDLIERAARRFGNQAIVVAIDVKTTGSNSGRVFTHAGKKETNINPVEWAREAVDRGAGEILLTSIVRDGMMNGYDLDLIRSVADAVTVPVIAQGGCGTLSDLVAGIAEGKADAVCSSAMLHFTDQSVIKARSYMKTYGIDVRIA